MGIHFTHRSGGPCWSRELGYHQPAPLPDHIMRVLTAPLPKPEPKKDDGDAPVGPKTPSPGVVA